MESLPWTEKDFRAQSFEVGLEGLEQPGSIAGKKIIREEAVSTGWSLGPVGNWKPLGNTCECWVVVLGGYPAKPS